MRAPRMVRRLTTITAAGVVFAVIAPGMPATAASPMIAPSTLVDADGIPIGAVPQLDGTYLLPGDIVVNVHGFDVTPAQLADIAAIAEATGTGLAEMIEDYLWQDEFGAFATELEEAFPDDYTGARRLEARGGPYIAFKGEVPDPARELVARMSRPVALIADRGYSQTELAEAQAAAFHHVVSHSQVVAASSVADDSTGVVAIEAEFPQQLTADQREQFRTAVQPAAPTNPALTVEVVVADDVGSYREEADLRGGGRFNSTPSTGAHSKCTTGFTVRHVSGSRPDGFATAGHCAFASHTRYYTTPIASTWTSHVYEVRHRGSSGDVATYRRGSSSNRLRPQFYSNTTAITNVFGARNPQIDDNLCMFGQASGRECATVDNLSACINVGEVCGLTRVDENVSGVGDSGGPWYAGGYAYGIHAGSTSNNSYFTRVTRLSSLWGMVVLHV